MLLGAVLGFLGSIPAAGPLALLIVARAVEGAPRRSLALGIGGAIAESLWAFAASTGVTRLVMGARATLALRLAAAVVLIVLGLAMLRRPQATKEARREGLDLGVGFLLVATNPAFLATWIALSAVAARLSPSFTPTGLAVGAGLGVAGWFALVTVVATRFRLDSPRGLEKIRRVSAALVLVGGLLLAFDTLR